MQLASNHGDNRPPNTKRSRKIHARRKSRGVSPLSGRKFGEIRESVNVSTGSFSPNFWANPLNTLVIGSPGRAVISVENVG